MSKTVAEFYAEHPVVQKAVATLLANNSFGMKRLRVKQIDSIQHRYGALVGEGEVALRSLNAPFAATAGSVTSPVSEKVTIVGAQIKTDHRLGLETHAAEISRRVRQVARAIDHYILNGDGLNQQNEIVGLKNRIEGDQLLDCGTDGGVPTLDQLYKLVDAVEDQGGGKLLIMNKGSFRMVREVVIGEAGGASVMDVVGPLPRFEDCEVIVAGKNHLGGELLPFTETQGDSDDCSSIYCIAPGVDELLGVQLLMASNSIEVIDEGVRDSQKIDTVEAAFGLVVYSPQSAARLQGVRVGTVA